jgi:hypothetical protein
MTSPIRRSLTLAAAALTLLSGSALAQGKGQAKEKNKDKSHRDDVVRVESNGRTAPGLAKKPGGMPPGQYKKLHPTQGASVLREVLGRHGYTYVRTTPYGESQYVYYRAADGVVRRAIVSQGPQRLTFTNVPSSLLQEVLSLLY